MSFFRGFGDDMPLHQWLATRIWPAEGSNVDDCFVRDGMHLAIAEMIRSGTTCFNDMYHFPDIGANVLLNTGMRGVLGHIILDFPTIYAPSGAEEYFIKVNISSLASSSIF